ncbi:hypothetical protein UFOVP343_23 [uncultured Caudovirales phage]|uniref:Uncharacterized protein n=1 Tax=uncultured Caudovirales phage TaxID=2100421 RepID=A0A6J5M041_9CAUD|nr:hypothetical protein UFOVP343_23 [uncultured Caudovirales phage]
MNMNKAEIIDGKVVNVIVVDPDNIPDWCASWPETDQAGPGWLYQDGQFLPPPPVVPTREEQEAARKAAYVAEADPIFFVAQRGEATTEEWAAKVNEIKARFPYPVE